MTIMTANYIIMIAISLFVISIIIHDIDEFIQYKNQSKKNLEIEKCISSMHKNLKDLNRYNTLKELQKADGLIIDGRCGPDTIKAIKELEEKINMETDLDFDEEKAKEAIDNYFTYTIDNDSPEIIKELALEVIDNYKNLKVGSVRYNPETDSIQCYMSDDTWIDFNASSIPENEYSDESDKLFEPKSKVYTSDNYNRPLECHHCGAPAKDRECKYCGSILWQY